MGIGRQCRRCHWGLHMWWQGKLGSWRGNSLNTNKNGDCKWHSSMGMCTVRKGQGICNTYGQLCYCSRGRRIARCMSNSQGSQTTHRGTTARTTLLANMRMCHRVGLGIRVHIIGCMNLHKFLMGIMVCMFYLYSLQTAAGLQGILSHMSM
jgi:hypothetical protein